MYLVIRRSTSRRLLVIQAEKDTCILCKKTKDVLFQYRNRLICNDCRRDIASASRVKGVADAIIHCQDASRDERDGREQDVGARYHTT